MATFDTVLSVFRQHIICMYVNWKMLLFKVGSLLNEGQLIPRSDLCPILTMPPFLGIFSKYENELF